MAMLQRLEALLTSGLAIVIGLQGFRLTLQIVWRLSGTTDPLGPWEEFCLHVRAGFAAELEMEDLKEVLLQVAIYAGVAAANSGFRIAAGPRGPTDSAITACHLMTTG